MLLSETRNQAEGKLEVENAVTLELQSAEVIWKVEQRDAGRSLNREASFHDVLAGSEASLDIDGFQIHYTLSMIFILIILERR